MVFRAIYNASNGSYKRWKLLSSEPERRAQLASLGIDKPHVWQSFAGLQDLDLNLHMNNAAYVRIAELARWDFAAQNGLLSYSLNNRLMFLLAGQHFSYRASIAPFAKFEVQSRFLAIDERHAYLRQTFLRPPSENVVMKVYCEATIKAAFKTIDGKRFSPPDIMASLGIPGPTIEKIRSTESARREAFMALEKLTHDDARSFKT